MSELEATPVDADATPDAPETPEALEPTEAPEADEAPAEPAAPAAAPGDEPLVTPGMDWFVLRVASNKEDSVRRTLLRKVKIEGYDGEHPEKPMLVSRILVPTEKTKVMKAGKQKVVETKLYPGYVFVEMKLEDDGRIPQDIFFLIKETTGVGDFIGTAGRPSAMSLPEVEKMINAAKPPEEQPQVRHGVRPRRQHQDQRRPLRKHGRHRRRAAA